MLLNRLGKRFDAFFPLSPCHAPRGGMLRDTNQIQVQAISRAGRERDIQEMRSELKSDYRIGHMLPWDEIGGTEIATLRIAQGVKSHGFENVMFCRESAPPPLEFFREANFETATYDVEYPDLRYLRGFLYRVRQLARELKQRRIDLVHCADVSMSGVAIAAAKFAQIPVMSHVRNRHLLLNPRDRRFLGFVNKFIFVSQNTWKEFPYKVPPRRGVVVYDGIEAPSPQELTVNSFNTNREVRREFGISDEAKIIGMVARIGEQKDYLTLAKAAQRVVGLEPQVRFLIVGSYSQSDSQREYYAKVRQMLAAHNVEPFFIFTDYRKDVKRLMSAFDIFVLSTHFEGLPLVILEAMAARLPIVATDVDGVPEIVLDGKNGLLHKHEDDSQLAALLLSLLRDEAHAKMLGEAGQRFVRDKFSRERFISNTANVYRSLLGLSNAEAELTDLKKG